MGLNESGKLLEVGDGALREIGLGQGEVLGTNVAAVVEEADCLPAEPVGGNEVLEEVVAYVGVGVAGVFELEVEVAGEGGLGTAYLVGDDPIGGVDEALEAERAALGALRRGTSVGDEGEAANLAEMSEGGDGFVAEANVGAVGAVGIDEDLFVEREAEMLYGEAEDVAVGDEGVFHEAEDIDAATLTDEVGDATVAGKDEVDLVVEGVVKVEGDESTFCHR